MAAQRSWPCKLLLIVLHPNREHRRDAYASMKPSLSRLAVKIVFVLFFLFLFTDIGEQLTSLALVLDHCGGVYAAMIKRQSQLLF